MCDADIHLLQKMNLQKIFGLSAWRKSRNVLLVRLELVYGCDAQSLADIFDLMPATVCLLLAEEKREPARSSEKLKHEMEELSECLKIVRETVIALDDHSVFVTVPEV